MKSFSWRAYLLTASATFLTVFLALFAAGFSLAETFPLMIRPSLLLGLCLLSALASALVCAVPRASLRAGLGVLLCGLLALYVWWRWEDCLTGAQAVFHHISYTFFEEIPSVPYYVLPRDLSLRQEAQATGVFFSAAVPLLGLWLGPWLTRRGPVWPAVGTAAALAGLPLLLLRQPGPVVLGAFLLFLALVLLSRTGYQENAATGARRALTSVLPVLLTLVLLGAVLPRSFNPRPQWVDNLRLGLQRIPTGGFTIGVGGVSATPGRQPLKNAGPLNFDGHTVLQIHSSSSQSPLFLRGFSAGKYTSDGWEAIDEPSPAQQWAEEESPFLFPYLAQSHRETDTVRIIDMGTHTNYYYLPYYPSALPSGGIVTDDAYLTRPDLIIEYRVSFLAEKWADPSAYLTGAEAAYLSEQEYRQWVYDHYLDVPYDLLSGEAFADLNNFSASVIYGANPVDVARALRDYLASFTVYDQQTPKTPEGEDFVSWFLTESHRGYCLHYASAATLMLRACGIPTRYVAGYVARPGRANAVTNVPDRNAHAWVEVYVDGFGWQPVDVTPGFSGGGTLDDPYAVDPEPTPDPTPTPSPSAPAPTPSPTPAPSATPAPSPFNGPEASLAQRLTAYLPALYTSLGLLLAAGLLLLQRRLRLARLRRRCAQDDPNQAAVALYRYLLALDRRAKVPVPDEAEALAQKAYFSQHTLTPEERAAMEAMARAAANRANTSSLPRRLLLKYVWALL